ncbi:MAG TPA: flavin reductase [Actinomycetota bacterium]|nr:flavin reductase [Actinomycetota bacterium]
MGRREDAPVEFDLPIGAFPSWAADALASGAWEEEPAADELQIEGEEGEDPVLAFRRTLGMFATGVTVITTTSQDQVHGMTANAFMSVSLRPPLVLISVDNRAKMHALLNEGKRIGISVLSEEQEALSDRFAGRPGGSGPEPSFEVVHETPLVEGALAHLVAHVQRSYWGGDHSLFLARVEYARYGQGKPLLFHGGHYEALSAPEGSILGALPPAMRERLLSAGDEHTYAAGETVITQGDRSAEAYVILGGRARVVRDGREIASLGRGQFFGEVAMLDGRPRTADVVAESQLRAIALSRDTVRRALRSEPDLAWRVLEVLAGRVRG